MTHLTIHPGSAFFAAALTFGIAMATQATSAGGGATGHAGVPDELTAQRLVLVDPEGRARIVATASPTPLLVFKSEQGDDQVRLAIGGENQWFPFDQENVPHLSLKTGHAEAVLSVSPPPDAEGLDEQFRVGSATLKMSCIEPGLGSPLHGKLMQLGVFPNKAQASITTLDPDDPLSIYQPSVQVFVDEAGTVSTSLGREGEDAHDER